MATHKALVLHKWGDVPVLQDTLKPVPKPGQLLVRVDATTINPSDRLRLSGGYIGYEEILSQMTVLDFPS